LDEPELERKKLSTLYFYLCHDRTRKCRKETKQDIFGRSTASSIEYLHERLQSAQQEFTSDSKQLLNAVGKSDASNLWSAYSAIFNSLYDYFDPKWTLGDAMSPGREDVTGLRVLFGIIKLKRKVGGKRQIRMKRTGRWDKADL
jgi:hypothetical protein